MSSKASMVGVRIAAAGLALALTGCKARVDPRRVVLRDQGAICFGRAPTDTADAGAGADIRANEPLAIAVRSPCLSVGCATERAATCAVKRDGDRLMVTSELQWRGPEDLGTRCTAECTFLDAQCTTEALPPGAYKVVLGPRTVDLIVPSHLTAECDEERLPAAVVPTPAAQTAAPVTTADPSRAPAAPGTGVVDVASPGDTICVGPARLVGDSRALRSGQAIAITVLRKNQCAGSSCTAAPGKCTAKRKGTQIAVSVQFPSSTTKPTSPCTEDCSALAATCRTDALPTGSYTIEVGTQRRTFQIPSPSAPACGP